MYGYFIKRNDNDFVINVELNSYGSGYNVVPKSVDKWNAYDINAVRQYADENPDMQVVWDEELGKYVPVNEPVLLGE
jgi:hypothetical protein